MRVGEFGRAKVGSRGVKQWHGALCASAGVCGAWEVVYPFAKRMRAMSSNMPLDYS